MAPITGDGRTFLFLQGPHGPFFRQLGEALRQTGSRVLRVGFNAGDRFFWGRQDYVAFRDDHDAWPDFVAQLFEEDGVTDLLLYGDTRPIHRVAIELARAKGIRVHVLEEGYLRPYWVSYERDGSNGNSPLRDMTLQKIRETLREGPHDHVEAPDHWGDTRNHVFYGALYHFCVLALPRLYPDFRPHRELGVGAEFRLYLRKLALMPWLAIHRARVSRRVRRGGFPYHLVLLQLEHDANFRNFSPFRGQKEFISAVTSAFARGAPAHHHLVFKAHPLEDGRVPLHREIEFSAKEQSLGTRVHYLPGGKLGPLLDHAASAITVNSTAGQQALWRGLPLRVFGASVYDRPEFVSHAALEDFFADPPLPDREGYLDFRQFLLETSQFPGGYYSRRGRRQLLRRLPDALLAPRDPYQMVNSTAPKAAVVQHLGAMR